MSGLSPLRLKWLRAIGRMPSAGKIEARRQVQQKLYERCRDFITSQQYKRFQEIEGMIARGEIDRMREQCNLATYQGSPEECMIQDFKQLGQSDEVRTAIENHGKGGGETYRRYVELKNKVESAEFQSRVEFLKDKKRFKRTPEGQAEAEFKRLRASKEVKWFQKQQQAGVIDRMNSDSDAFFDDFTDTKLNTQRWASRFFWGDAMLGRPYSFMGDPHAYTDGSNLRVENSCLIIETRHEPADGLAWDSQLGFLPKHFDYTSGVVTSGQSFRQEKGKFEMKVRFTSEPGVYHAIYLTGEKRTPEVDIFRSATDDGHYISGIYLPDPTGASEQGRVGALPFDKEFFIVSVEWTSGSIVWKINEVPYMEVSNRLPNEPLYLVIASGIEPDAHPQGVSRLEVDWVRCSQL